MGRGAPLWAAVPCSLKILLGYLQHPHLKERDSGPDDGTGLGGKELARQRMIEVGDERISVPRMRGNQQKETKKHSHR